MRFWKWFKGDVDATVQIPPPNLPPPPVPEIVIKDLDISEPVVSIMKSFEGDSAWLVGLDGEVFKHADTGKVLHLKRGRFGQPYCSENWLNEDERWALGNCMDKYACRAKLVHYKKERESFMCFVKGERNVPNN